MNEVGERIAKAMKKIDGQDYEWGQARDVLYASSGSTKDWVLEERNVSLSWTWELRDTGDYSALFPPEDIAVQWREVEAGLITLIEYIVL